MINGVPINDMEWGGVYWSNWAGLAEVTRSMQTQRGLGASKVSAPSVGGTINIVTKSLDAKAGGSFAYGIGNDGANQMTFTISSGVTENGWAVTVLGGHKWGKGYIQGTEYNGWNYFVNVSKRIGANHQLSLTAFGAPQEHWQRNKYDGLTIEGWQRMKQYMGDDKSPYLYNATYGFDKNGQRRTSAFNKYHKPQISEPPVADQRPLVALVGYIRLDCERLRLWRRRHVGVFGLMVRLEQRRSEHAVPQG